MSAKKPSHIVVSGVQPSGRSHLGNYVGAYQQWVKIQNNVTNPARCFFFIADYHSITENYDPARKRQQVLELAADLLALGIDPKKSVLFVQSDVPEHTELGWILNSVTPISFLERMTQFKDKAGRQKENINVGLFDYPVLQAADVLMYKATAVPVGRDQLQHIELTRDIARFFNNRFGRTFREEITPLMSLTPKLRGLNNPLKKMSKSLGENSFIALADEPDVIWQKVKSAVTETTGILKYSEEELERKLSSLDIMGFEGDPDLKGQAGVWNLLTMLKIFGKPHEADRIYAAQPIKYAELKRLVADRIADYFADFRRRRAALLAEPKQIWAVLAAGAKKARSEAKKTMVEVRKKIGLR